jgi:hypothetical protein
MGAIGKPLEHFSNREMAGRSGSPERTTHGPLNSYEQTIGMIYRARERVDRLMALIEQGYNTERQAAQEAHDQVIALLDQFPVEPDGREGRNA